MKTTIETIKQCCERLSSSQITDLNSNAQLAVHDAIDALVLAISFEGDAETEPLLDFAADEMHTGKEVDDADQGYAKTH